MRKARITNYRCSGFTILELIIAIAIVGVLATLSIPSFEQHIQKVKRADAQSALLELAHFMERNYTKKGGYLTNGATGGNPILPFTATPRGSTNASYQISFSTITAQAYTLQAQPVTGSGQSSDTCGTLTLAHTGATGPTTNNCWAQ